MTENAITLQHSKDYIVKEGNTLVDAGTKVRTPSAKDFAKHIGVSGTTVLCAVEGLPGGLYFEQSNLRPAD